MSGYKKLFLLRVAQELDTLNSKLAQMLDMDLEAAFI